MTAPAPPREDAAPPGAVVLSEREAIATLRVIAAMNGGFVARVYGGGKSPPLRVRTVRGFAVVNPVSFGALTWDLRPTWLYSVAQEVLLWAAPNVLKGYASYVKWRGIDDPEAEP